MSYTNSTFNYGRDLESLKTKGLFRHLNEINSAQGPVINIRGRELINFSSNDYLGMANDERLKKKMHEAVDKYGVGSGASQLICGRSEAHLYLEQQLADFLGRDRALVFSTGYMANLSVVTALGPGRKGHIYEDRLNHASLIDGAILSRAKLVRYKHKDVDSLACALGKSKTMKMVLTDSVFSMDGDIAPLDRIANTCEEHGALLAVDDAHGFGVLGKNAMGTLSTFGLEQADVPVLVLTFGKALGVFGACVAGPSEIIETLVQKARPYIYTTALPPALAETVSMSLKIIRDDDIKRARLKELIYLFQDQANASSLPVKKSETPIQPFIVGDSKKALELSQRLLERGILIKAIRPPAVPANSARLRITLTASHTKEQVLQLLDVLDHEYRKH